MYLMSRRSFEYKLHWLETRQNKNFTGATYRKEGQKDASMIDPLRSGWEISSSDDQPLV